MFGQAKSFDGPIHDYVLKLSLGGRNGKAETWAIEGYSKDLSDGGGGVDRKWVVTKVLGGLPVHTSIKDGRFSGLKDLLHSFPFDWRGLGKLVTQEAGFD